jgi:hypothetical protein
MKFLQIAFIAILSVSCVATYTTSQTLHTAGVISEQEITPAPTNS